MARDWTTSGLRPLPYRGSDQPETPLLRSRIRHYVRVDNLKVTGDLNSLVRSHDHGEVAALYLYGSAVAGGLRQDSDIDLLLVTRRSLHHDEREGLVDFLLNFSGRRAIRAPGRPMELTSLVLEDVVPWTYPPVCDFLYGEWLRDDFVEGRVPERHVNLTSRSWSRAFSSTRESSQGYLPANCWFRCLRRISADP